MQFSVSSPQYPYAPTMFEKGGQIKNQQYGLIAAAEQLRQRGRGKDTVLAHITPEEAGILQLLGGSGTINPYTGLPEFLRLKDLNPVRVVKKIGSALDDAIIQPAVEAVKDVGRAVDDVVLQPVFKAANDVAEALGPVGAIAAAYFGGPLGAAVYSGFQAPGDDFSFKRAAQSAALTYAGQNLMEGAVGGGGGASPMSASDYGAAVDSIDEAAGAIIDSTVPGGIPVGVGEAAVQNIPATVPTGAGAAVTPNVLPDLPPPIQYPVASIPDVQPVQVAQAPSVSDVSLGIGSLPTSAVDSVTSFDIAQGQAPDIITPTSAGSGLPGIPDAIKNLTLKDAKEAAQLAALGTTAYGAYGAYQEKEKAEEEQKRLSEEQQTKEAETKGFAESVLREYPLQFSSLTAEDVRRYGLAAGGAIRPDFDDEGDDRESPEYAFGGTVKNLKTSFKGLSQGVRNAFSSALPTAKAAPATAGIASVIPYTGPYNIAKKYAGRSYAGLDAEDVRALGLAKGGALAPRFLSGAGDGMSDSIPARIGGTQEARLADGEFVIPADVVSHIGNGSSKAGAKKLYAMMDRVRRARTGKTRQAPEINAKRLLPV